MHGWRATSRWRSRPRRRPRRRRAAALGVRARAAVRAAALTRRRRALAAGSQADLRLQAPEEGAGLQSPPQEPRARAESTGLKLDALHQLQHDESEVVVAHGLEALDREVARLAVGDLGVEEQEGLDGRRGLAW